jgi:hypothetical protein
MVSLSEPPPVERGILVQPLRAATVCELDLVRGPPDHRNGLKPGYRNRQSKLTHE